jgi:hypothetical protein
MSRSLIVKFTMTRAEYAAALRTVLLRRRIIWVMIAAFAFFTSGPFITYYSRSAQTPAAPFPMAALIYPGIGLLALAWLFGVVPILAVRRMNPASRDQEQVFTFSDEGATVVSATGEAKFLWSAWIKYQETGRFFLLYPSKQIVHIMPKRAFASEQELVDFRNLLKQKVRS